MLQKWYEKKNSVGSIYVYIMPIFLQNPYEKIRRTDKIIKKYIKGQIKLLL